MGEPYADQKPRAGTRGHYHGKGATGLFTVVRVEGNLCFAEYDANPGPRDPFIWRHPEGLNTLHDWPGKNSAPAA